MTDTTHEPMLPARRTGLYAGSSATPATAVLFENMTPPNWLPALTPHEGERWRSYILSRLPGEWREFELIALHELVKYETRLERVLGDLDNNDMYQTDRHGNDALHPVFRALALMDKIVQVRRNRLGMSVVAGTNPFSQRRAMNLRAEQAERDAEVTLSQGLLADAEPAAEQEPTAGDEGPVA